MSERLNCECGNNIFVPVYYLERNEKGEVIKIRAVCDYMCTSCSEITTFYTE